MDRWNGWGDQSIIYPLPESASVFLENVLGELKPSPDARLEDVLAAMPAARHSPHLLLSSSEEERLRHARGQSLPDWVALRSGRIPAFPDALAYPTSTEDIRELLAYARQSGARLIPYGGGTSVVGHINPQPGASPVVTVDMRRMERMLDLDESSRLATFQAGVTGPFLEKQLREHGYTLGHFPQSFERSTLGGWLATRSSGQQSYYYGRVEDTFAGGRLETPRGPVELPPFPASAAGPDLRHMILGSEGRLGIISEALMRIQLLPEAETFYGVFFRDWESGVNALRAICQAGIPLSMLRLSDPLETATTLLLSGKEDLVTWAGRGLRLLGYREGRCLLIYGVTGSRADVRRIRREANAVFRVHSGFFTGQTIGKLWKHSRFRSAYLRNTLWERGVAVDTLETALPWSQALPAAEAIKAAIQDAFEGFDERVHVFAHLSHVYRDGASIYATYLFRRTPDPDQLLERWRAAKYAASRVVLAHGGTISHQHGVGTDHAPYLQAEKGRLGLEAIEAARKTFDPEGLLNPGKLLL